MNISESRPDTRLKQLCEAGFTESHPAYIGTVWAKNAATGTRIEASINRNGLMIHIDSGLQPISTFEDCTVRSVIELAKFLGCIS